MCLGAQVELLSATRVRCIAISAVRNGVPRTPRPTIATQAATPADSALALLSDSALQNRGVMAAMTAEAQQDLKFSALATASMAAEAQEANEDDDDAKPRRKPSVKWVKAEDDSLRALVEAHGPKNWKWIAERLQTTAGSQRTDVQCLHRWNKVLRPGLHKGAWTAAEDEVVKQMVTEYGVGNIKWSEIAAKLPGRLGKQIRERWFNQLDPTINKGDWAADEDTALFEAQRDLGNRWIEIAKRIPGRTENAVKNRFHSAAWKKYVVEAGLDRDGGSDPAEEVTDSSSSNADPSERDDDAAAGYQAGDSPFKRPRRVTLGEFREVVVPSSEASSRPSLLGPEDESAAFAAAQVLSCITPRGYTPVQSAFAKVGLASAPSRETENEQEQTRDSPDQN